MIKGGKFKQKKGFTLIEVLAVIVILAIIMTISVPAVLGRIEIARKKAFYINTKAIVDRIKQANQANGGTHCMYQYDINDDTPDNIEEFKVDNIKEISVINSNGKYSVLALSSEENDDPNQLKIDIADFYTLNDSDFESWKKDDEKSYTLGSDIGILSNDENTTEENTAIIKLYVSDMSSGKCSLEMSGGK